MDILITIPKSVSWETYTEELDRALRGEILHFKTSGFPKKARIGDRCFVVWKGAIRGCMYISGFSEKEFECSTTGKIWKGKFIERTGDFFVLEDPIPFSGFQGFRYFDAPDSLILDKREQA